MSSTNWLAGTAFALRAPGCYHRATSEKQRTRSLGGRATSLQRREPERAFRHPCTPDYNRDSAQRATCRSFGFPKEFCMDGIFATVIGILVIIGTYLKLKEKIK